LLPNLLGMGQSPLILAALATDAVSGLKVKNAIGISGAAAGNFDSALITDVNGDSFIVRVPTTPTAGAELELEIQVLKSLSAFSARLGFEIPQKVGETRDLSTGNRVLVFKYVHGNPIDTRRMNAASAITQSIAKAISTIHSLPIELVQNNGLSEFSPAENIRLRVAELDRAMQSGQVPPILLQRWEEALSDVSLFKYQPVIVHGSLAVETLLEKGGEVSGILDWQKVQLGDPALDFGWLANEAPELLESILLNYQLSRTSADGNIAKRAALYAELEWVRWLVHGYAVKDTAIVEEAILGLQELAGLASEGQLPPLTASAVAAAATVSIVETISFIEQETEPGFLAQAEPEFVADAYPATKPIDLFELQESEDQEPTKQDEDKDLF
jgi:aminoglycoside phosphotransferase (APT) family kinase protein